MDIKAAAAAYSNMAGIAQANPADDTKTDNASGPSFSELIQQALGSAVDSGYKAEKISTLALLGKSDLTELATAVSTAEEALDTIVTIRDKAISAYQQISQMAM